MGISTNQARLLSLTARKCDLETQMQLILNNKVNMARQTSKIANDYNEAISNRKLFIFKPEVDMQTSVYQDLTARNLYNTGGLMLAKKNANNSYAQIDTNNATAIEEGLRSGTIFMVKAADLKTQDPKIITFNANYGGDANGIISGPPLDASGNPVNTWEILDWRTSTAIMDELNKSDDESALMNYERSMNELKVKEAGMDLEMNSIQTSHSAISNEIESVKKIMTKNTEESFKYFS